MQKKKKGETSIPERNSQGPCYSQGFDDLKKRTKEGRKREGGKERRREKRGREKKRENLLQESQAVFQ